MDPQPVELRLPHRAPLAGEELIAFLGARAVPGVEQLIGNAYRRSLRLPHGPGVAELRLARGQVEASIWLTDPRDLDAAVRRCRELLDLDTDTRPIAERLGADPVIGAVVRRAPGRRVPGHVDAHELAMRAVLGQQVSLAAARTLAGRLVAAYGEPLERPVGAVTHLFPSARAIAHAELAEVGMPRSRRSALAALAGALASGEIDLGTGAHRARSRRALLALPGIGPWTVSYIAMRALRDPDAFIPSDLGVRRALDLLGQDSSSAAVLQLAERWRPYRAVACQHLWAILTKPPAANVHGAA